ncbi:MAG TPA: hypothetical protein VK698_14535 [Kofleriaceae bacterium]|nr:hypothetical protein [Kofleriaceae bacterium]
MTRIRRVAAAMALAVAVLGPLAAGEGRAEAQASQPAAAGSADCQIFEIKATNGEGGVDPALRPLARKLKKPPFSSWKTFKLLKKHDKKIEKMKTLNLGLVTGSKLTLLFRGASGGQPTKPRLRLTFTLDDKSGKRKLDGTINLDSGDYSLFGGDSIEDAGTYILAVSCSAP